MVTIIIIAILLILFAIYNIKVNEPKETSRNIQMKNSTEDRQKNIVKNIQEIRTPDEIIYYNGENKKVINKDEREFKKIVELNQNRKLEELQQLEIYVELDENKPNSFLEYKYYDDSSIYFLLKTDEKNYIWIPYDCKQFEGGAYGYIEDATELVKQLF